MTGPLPDYCLQALSSLRILSAAYNQLEGSIPFTLLSELHELQEIWLQENQFTGELELGLYKMVSLTHLCLDHNLLTGEISPKISKLQQLKYLSLAQNQLSGVIPESIIGLQELEVLSLHSNRLTGKVPMFLEMIPRLDELRLYGNEGLVDEKGERIDRSSIVTVKSAIQKQRNG